LQCLERVLYVWTIRHPASGYVQGINDLVTPFFSVFLSQYVGEPDFFLSFDSFGPENENVSSLSFITF